MTAKKIGILGGSFDPVHHGHINLAVEMIEAHDLDEVWFCPSSINPNKMKGGVAAPQQRLDMLHLVIAGESRFRLLDTEIKRQGTSFTIDTLEELQSAQAGKPDPSQFFLIIGEDAAMNFCHWRRAEEIALLVPILVGRRLLGTFEKFNGSPMMIESLKKGITQIRIMEVSSTEVRQRLSKGLYCGHLVHSKVLDYIYLHHLYYKSNDYS